MSEIIVISTGGTISMTADSTTGAFVTGQSAVSPLEAVYLPDGLGSVRYVEFVNLPSPHFTLPLMWQLRNLVLQYINMPEVGGIVITHGTDTLEETAYLLDLTLPTVKPVVLVGAMNSCTDACWDGAPNLVAAIKVASHEASQGQGVLVVMNNGIHSARHVAKIHTTNMNSLSSGEAGLLGIVDKDKVIYYHKLIRPVSLNPASVETNVDLIKVYTGMDARYLYCSVSQGAKGIVVEAMGRGNVPPQIMPAIIEAMANGIIVVLTSRSPHGRVLDVYGYEGAGHQLKAAGVIFAGDLSGLKARLQLCVGLGAGLTRNELEAYLGG